MFADSRYRYIPFRSSWSRVLTVSHAVARNGQALGRPALQRVLGPAHPCLEIIDLAA